MPIEVNTTLDGDERTFDDDGNVPVLCPQETGCIEEATCLPELQESVVVGVESGFFLGRLTLERSLGVRECVFDVPTVLSSGPLA